MSESSVTGWMNQLRNNDADAAGKLWNRYFDKITAAARRELQKAPPRRAYDDEDVALSAFDAFVRGLQAGKYESLGDRQELWRLLVVITVRKANDRAKSDRAQKRGRGRNLKPLEDLSREELDRFLAHKSDPQATALAAEQCREMLELLAEDKLEGLAMMKLDGHTNQEIAEILGCTRQTVQRRLRLIREIWTAAYKDLVIA